MYYMFYPIPLKEVKAYKKELNSKPGYRCIDMPDHESSKCFIYRYDTLVVLVSYKTVVASYDTCTGFIWCADTHSVTTCKHITYFARYLRDTYGLNITGYDFKECVTLEHHTKKVTA